MLKGKSKDNNYCEILRINLKDTAWDKVSKLRLYKRFNDDI